MTSLPSAGKKAEKAVTHRRINSIHICTANTKLDPGALLQLKATESCEVELPEWLFDLDCPGHYFRRIKAVSLSIPCIAGPYTSVNCTLSLQKSTIRKSSLGDSYARDTGNEDGRFLDYYGTIQSIVTSNAQNDSGLFETNLRDERYLPFEGAGAVSTWHLEIPSDIRQFDYNTITDVILHLRYTAREGGQSLRDGAVANFKTLFGPPDASLELFRLFSLQHDYPNEWHRYSTGTDETMKIVLKKEQFPYFTNGRQIKVSKMELHSIQANDLTSSTLTRSEDELTQLSEEINTASPTPRVWLYLKRKLKKAVR